MLSCLSAGPSTAWLLLLQLDLEDCHSVMPAPCAPSPKKSRPQMLKQLAVSVGPGTACMLPQSSGTTRLDHVLLWFHAALSRSHQG